MVAVFAYFICLVGLVGEFGMKSFCDAKLVGVVLGLGMCFGGLGVVWGGDDGIRFNVVELAGFEGQQVTATSMDENGRVTGVVNGERAFVWDQNGEIILFPTKDRTVGYGTNTTARAMGSIFSDAKEWEVFLWVPERAHYEILPIPAGAFPTAINKWNTLGAPIYTKPDNISIMLYRH